MSRIVLLVVDGLGLSGKTKALVDLACGLDETHYRPVVCSFYGEEGPLTATLAARAVPVHHIPCEDGVNVKVVMRLVRLMRDIRPAVVHCYNPRPMLYGGIVAGLLGIRATLGSLSAFACEVPDREHAFLPQRLVTVTRRNRLRNRVTAKLMRRLVTMSPALGERFCRWSGVPTKVMRVVPYGVAVDANVNDDAEDLRAARRELGAASDHVLVGSVGRLVEQKDYPTQIAGFAQAARQEPRLRMVLVGEGPLRASIEAQVAELGLTDRIKLVGHRTDVPRLMRALDVYVITSKFEPYGVSLLEAKAAGRAIVATEVNEIPGILSHGRSGLLVPPGAPDRVGAALIRLAGDADLRDTLAKIALQEAVEKHSLRAMVDGYQALYDEVRGDRTAAAQAPGA